MEVLTFQFGPSANYVGTHFWNIQEASNLLDSDAPERNVKVLSRESEDVDGRRSYVPRLLVFDAADNFGALSKSGNVSVAASEASASSAASSWDGSAQLVTQSGHKKSAFLRALDDADAQFKYFQQVKLGNKGAKDPLKEKKERRMELEGRVRRLAADSSVHRGVERELSDFEREIADLDDDLSRMLIRQAEQEGKLVDVGLLAKKFAFSLDSTVTHWSDYLKSFVHPRSICPLPNSYFSSISNVSVAWSSGEQALRNVDERDEVENSLHWFLEECDRLEAVQSLVDINGAFGSFAQEVLLMLHDEAPRSRSLVVGLYDQDSSSKMKALNLGLATAAFTEHASVFVPLALNQLPDLPFSSTGNPKNVYQNSAVVASVLELLSHPSKFSQSSLSQLCDTIAPSSSQPIAAVDVALPLAVGQTSLLTDLLDRDGAPIFNAAFLASLSPSYARTDLSDPWSSVPIFTATPKESFASSPYFANPRHCIMAYLSNHLPKSRMSFISPSFIAAPISFPRFFSPRISSSGALLAPHERRPEHEIVQQYSSVVHFQTSSRQHAYLQSIAADFGQSKADAQAMQQLDLTFGDHEDIASRLNDTADSYKRFDSPL